MKQILFTAAMLLFGAVLIVCAARTLAQCSYTCRHCGGTFHITLRRALFMQHVNEDYILLCPYCGKKGWCRRALSHRKGED